MPLLSEAIERSGAVLDRISGDAPISGIDDDTRTVSEGDLFVCMPSDSRDTHELIPEALGKGAAAVLAHSQEGFQGAVEQGVPAMLSRKETGRFEDAVWRLAAEVLGRPSRKIRVVGVTGTNGKTTTAWLVREALMALGHPAAYLGTLGIQTPAGSRELANTTPFPIALQKLLCEVVESGATHLAMEVSSHALEQRRADGVEFDVGVFTNLTQDHLDFHGSMDSYASAKRRLFLELPRHTSKRFVAVLNKDDREGAAIESLVQGQVLTYGFQHGEIRGRADRVELDRLTLSLEHGADRATLEAQLGGAFNATNCLSAAAGLVALGIDLMSATRGLAKARPVPGRFEAVRNEKGIGIIVDYAHTPDALTKLLGSVRGLNPKRIITVFGCGGDRDKAKRPLMAQAVCAQSDAVVVTSDNPRTEDPEAIIADIERGIEPTCRAVRVTDRRAAIQRAISMAERGDVVVIAGKGHENYQIIGKTKVPMDDRELARKALEGLN